MGLHVSLSCWSGNAEECQRSVSSLSCYHANRYTQYPLTPCVSVRQVGTHAGRMAGSGGANQPPPAITVGRVTPAMGACPHSELTWRKYKMHPDMKVSTLSSNFKFPQ